MLLDQSSLTTQDWVKQFSFLPQKHKASDSHNVQNADCVAWTFLPERLLEETIAVNSLSREFFLGGGGGGGNLGLVMVFSEKDSVSAKTLSFCSYSSIFLCLAESSTRENPIVSTSVIY